MSTRLDMVLKRFPEHEDGIRLLATRDPSGNGKYLDWGAKVLASGQALAPEVADVVELFHRFSGQWFGPGQRHQRKRIHPDIYAYRPHDLAILRDNLNKLQRAQDKKRRQREKLYRIDGSVEIEVVYDSPDLVVRHIKNKQASCHYGLGTKWCIAMTREGYFEDYESHNATFFFFERKVPLGDEFDKMALMVPRNGEDDGGVATAFTSTDRSVDILTLAKVHGPRVFDILRAIHECSERYPGSAMHHVYAGTATAEQIAIVFADIGKVSPIETASIIESVCCNDAAPWTLLEEVWRQAINLHASAWGRYVRHRRRRPSASQMNSRVAELTRTVLAALLIHPHTPAEVREKIVKNLRRRRVNLADIHRVKNRIGRVGVSIQRPLRKVRHRYRGRRRRGTSGMSVPQLVSQLAMHDGRAARTRKRYLSAIKKLKKKLAAKKRRK